MRWKGIFVALILALPSICCGDDSIKVVKAKRISKGIKIDGVLNESVWKGVVPATHFIQNSPVPGKPEQHKTEVKIVYDNTAIYLAATMFDVARDSVLKELGQRDELKNTDYFKLFLDTHDDQLNAYSFTVTSAGVQLDSRYSSNGEDLAWNAVWLSETRILKDRWIAEVKIPFSALRFSESVSQEWGINFLRHIQRSKESFYWNPVKPEVEGIINQSGKLEGLDNISSPLRLSFTPYLSTYAANYSARLDKSRTPSFLFNAGMDVKYGLTESFTLDATLVPDFGQIQSDNLVLNLSPYEVQFTENRPFFQEGTDLFNKGNFFYSRRIGGPPLFTTTALPATRDGEVLIENPSNTRLLNATKITGRTKKGLGVGVLNATTANMYAKYRNSEGAEHKIMTQPFSNYSVLVLDQSLKNNSYVSLINTLVMRKGSFYDAGLLGAVFRLADKTNTYAVSGRGAISKFWDSIPANGHTFTLSVAKISGNFQYNLEQHVESNTYNPNDLGILVSNNKNKQRGTLNYNIYEPFWKVNNLSLEVGSEYSRLYHPYTYQNIQFFGSVKSTLKNFKYTELIFNIQPLTSFDFFEPRSQGRYYIYPRNYTLEYFLTSDSRKKLYWDSRIKATLFKENKRNTVAFYGTLRYRFNNHFSLSYNIENENKGDNVGFVHNSQDSVFFGIRNLTTISNTLSFSYIFTNKIALTFRTRHYWSKVDYSRYQFLHENGFLSNTDYNENHNTNFNAFNIDMVFSWWFAPGSEIRIVFKDALLDAKEEIIPSYFNNWGVIANTRHKASLSFKVLYYFDWARLGRG